jgi:uncharacterized FAD-dependent dehydrogenase
METVQIQVLPEQLSDEPLVYHLALEKAGLDPQSHPYFRIRKRSIDARKSPVRYNLTIEFTSEQSAEETVFFNPQALSGETIHIIGAGPGGLFAALKALELGIKPIIFERGKDVRSRRRDLAILNKEGIVNPESNYCFGEGGAGTYSDGKLYTRSKKRGDVLKSLQWLVHFGASSDILVDAHPHIGTNKLPEIITSIREEIIRCGGEVHFEHKLTDIQHENNQIKSITINNIIEHPCEHLIIATGHSARDIFELLHKRNIKIVAKGFALGVRIEHNQELIDHIQYHGQQSNELLPPASYSLVTQVNGRGVYSFCMCPGGIVAPCATNQQEVVTNGWSPSKRNNPYSNSGIVVSLLPEDLPNYSETNPFNCLDFQKKVEYDCWEAAGKTQAVPAQRMIDFVEGRVSKDLPKSSYQPGVVSVDLNQILPPIIADALKKAFIDFGRKMKGYYTNDAILHAPESRTSSPISIPRDKETFEHVEITGLYPCAEGAGYAGGIISAAVDGMNCVNAIALKLELEAN